MIELVLAALLQTTPAPPVIEPEQPPVVVDATPENPAPQEGRVTCRYETPTGSTLTRRVCRTQALQNVQEDTAQRELERAHRPVRRYNGNDPVPQ